MRMKPRIIISHVELAHSSILRYTSIINNPPTHTLYNALYIMRTLKLKNEVDVIVQQLHNDNDIWFFRMLLVARFER
jgi:hypothetical protein